MTRLLIDSSVWIEYYRVGGPPSLREDVRTALIEDRVVTTGIVVVEILQGARTDMVYAALDEDFSALEWLSLTPTVVRQAARVGFDLCRRGTPVPATDLLIAAVALAHGCELWHLDAHFTRIQTVAPLAARQLDR